MQDVIEPAAETLEMVERHIDSYRIDALKEGQDKLIGRVDDMNSRLGELTGQLSKIQGQLNAPAKRNWLTDVIAPSLLVAAIIGGVSAYINMHGRLSAVESFLKNNEGFITIARLQHDATNPNDPHKIEDARNALALAKGRTVKIDPTTVREVGNKFIAAADVTPYAWQAALAFFSYHSLLNEDALPRMKQTPLPVATFSNNFDTDHSFTVAGDTRVNWFGHSASPNVAELRPLNGRNLNAGQPFGFEYLFVKNATVVLDGMYFKRIVFENSHITYQGGEAQLDMVYFINCTFDVQRNQRGFDFGQKLLAAAATNFRPIG